MPGKRFRWLDGWFRLRSSKLRLRPGPDKLWASVRYPGLEVRYLKEGDFFYEMALAGRSLTARWVPDGWAGSFWMPRSTEVHDPLISLDGQVWTFQISDTDDDSARILFGSSEWNLERIRFLTFRLTRRDTPAIIEFGPSTKLQLVEDVETFLLAAMLQLFKVDMGFSRWSGARAMAQWRRPWNLF